MELNKIDLDNLTRTEKINLMNSVTGAKPAILVGTKSKKNIANLAIFSSIVHVSSSPALFAFFTRTTKNTRRDTYENILDTNYYTFNHINPTITENAHLTSYKFSKDISEFSECRLTEEYLNNFFPPYVKESIIKIGLELREIIDFKSTSSKLVIGEVSNIYISKYHLSSNKILDLEKSNSVFVSGLNDYYTAKKSASYPYVKK